MLIEKRSYVDPEYQKVAIGETAYFYCKTKLDVIWTFQDNIVLPNNVEVGKNVDNGYSWLKISDVDLKNQGKYTCSCTDVRAQEDIPRRGSVQLRETKLQFQDSGAMDVVGKQFTTHNYNTPLKMLELIQEQIQ